MNHELHVKFLKINLKRKYYTEAIKHLIKIEYKYIFQRDQTLNSKWYEKIINIFEEFLKNEPEFGQLNKNEQMLFYFIFINLLINQLVNLIQSNVNAKQIEYFLR